VADAYDALVGRLPRSAERADVLARLQAGQRRASVARSVATSPDARRHLADTWYRILLGRPATAAEAGEWADAMAIGTSELTLVAELASTQLRPGTGT
jgi:hypothetical protein